MVNKLAIIIPAYKSEYFEQALNSLLLQTNKNFTVYVGDDFSPHDLKSICDHFAGKLNIKYTRFENNIGAKNLVNQWTRCVNLASDEEWIWLFSDDDIAEANCVEKFYETIELFGNRFDVFRFNTNVINQFGEITSTGVFGPQIESSEEMAFHLLMGRRGNSMPDHIFSRKIYTATGGFVSTAFAQAADWATSIKFSKQKGMCVIPNAKLFWRYSGNNISSLASSHKQEMSAGYFHFVAWVSEHFLYLRETPSTISYPEIMAANLAKLREVLVHHYAGISRKMYVPLFQLLTTHFGMNVISVVRFIIKVNTEANRSRTH